MFRRKGNEGGGGGKGREWGRERAEESERKCGINAAEKETGTMC